MLSNEAHVHCQPISLLHLRLPRHRPSSKAVHLLHRLSKRSLAYFLLLTLGFFFGFFFRLSTQRGHIQLPSGVLLSPRQERWY
jgi:hypothetical protein